MLVHFLTRPDGSVIFLRGAVRDRRDGETDEAFAARVLAVTLAKWEYRRNGESAEAHAARIADPAQNWKFYPVTLVQKADVQPLLDDYEARVARDALTYRDVWTIQAGTLTHDMPKARGLRMAEIRAERDRRLTASDGPMLRAQEAGTPPQIAAMKVARQTLRDVPQTTNLDGLTTVDALAAFEPVWPEMPG